MPALLTRMSIWPKSARTLCDQRVDLVRRGDVAGVAAAGPAGGGFDVAGDGGGLVTVAADDGDLCAGFGQAFGHGAAEALGGAGDDGGFAGE